MQAIRIALIAGALAAVPAAAVAYGDKPTTPPGGSGGAGNGGGSPVAVPAPAAIRQFAMGVAGLAVARRRYR